LNPAYKLPNRQNKFAKKLLPAEHFRIRAFVEETIKQAEDVAIASDGWTDVSSNRLINTYVHLPRPLHFHTIDATISRHTGPFIKDYLTEQFQKIDPRKVIALVTDHASNNINAAGLISNQFPWILWEGCKAHAIDLAAKDICQKTGVKSLIGRCVEIAKFFR
jgi:hypothetical protein